MATSATALSSFSSLSIHTSHSPTTTTTFSFKPTSITYSFKPTSLFSSLSFSNKPHKLKPLRAAEAEDNIEGTEEDSEDEPKSIDDDTFFFELETDEDIVFEPATPPEGYMPFPDFDELPQETDIQVAAAYEKLYGPAYSGVSVLNNDINVMDSKMKKLTGGFGQPKRERIRDDCEERVVQVRRVTKVVKGGKQMNFRAVVIVGDKKSRVGVGHGKAKEVISAVQKAAIDARRHMITVPMTKYLTFPHRADGKYGAASVMLRPASPGTGVIAGASVRIVLEMAGVNNALGKQLGSNNALNNARATIVAILKMRQFAEVSEYRGIPMEELWK